MKKIHLFLLVYLLVYSTLICAQTQNQVWALSDRVLQFTGSGYTTITTPYTPASISNASSAASMQDASGNLQFTYVNGRYYDANGLENPANIGF